MVVRQVPGTIEIKVTIPAGQAENSILPASIIVDPTVGEQGYVQLPINASMVIEDVFIKDTPSIDVVLRFIKNDTRMLLETPPVSTLLISNPSRPRVSPMIFYPGEKLTVKAVNLAKNSGTTAVTVTVYAKVVKFIEE